MGQQGLAFRGHNETPDSSNRGNFLELLYVLADYSPELREHLKAHERKSNATYMSPQSQNEFIQVIGIDYLLGKIIERVQKAKFFAILCDEASSAHKEFLALVLRYVEENTIREDFIGFSHVVNVQEKLWSTSLLINLGLWVLISQNVEGKGMTVLQLCQVITVECNLSLKGMHLTLHTCIALPIV